MSSNKLDSLVKKLSVNIKQTSPNGIYKDLLTGVMYQPLSKIIDAESFIILSYLIYYNKIGKYVDGMFVVIKEDLFTFSLAQVDENKVVSDCTECWGEGHTECRTCDGSGSEDCVECGGSGDVSCDTCDGYGELEDGETCQTCSGDGNITCNECDGDGSEICSDCDGDRHVDCDYCDGQGEIVNEDEYMVTEYVYASINDEILSKLSNLDSEDMFEDSVEDFTNNLKLTILIHKNSFSTENITHLNLDDDDIIFVGLNTDPKFVFLSNGITDSYLETVE